MRKINLNDTIVAISTPVGEGGIGIVRMSGKKALAISDKIFSSKNETKPSQFETYTTHYGHIIDSSSEIIDEIILTVMRAPKSYTKEDVVEINCHGGIVPLKKTLELVVSCGARIAEPGEFTRRAFLNGRIDLLQAEAVLDVIRAKTDAGLRAALSHLKGGLSGKIKEIKDEIMDFYAHIEASIDFPEEDIRIFNSIELSERIDAVLGGLEEMLETSQKGKLLREGISTVICGKPNVGKSTLMNAFLKENRVIVTHIPGTTRDVVEEVINIDGIPLRIADTAGIIEPANLIDKEGVERSRRRIKDADLVLLILDNSKKIGEKDKSIMNMVEDKKAIVVINKSDLAGSLNLNEIKKEMNGKEIIKISAINGTNLDNLEKAISNMIWNGKVLSGHEALITNVRHADALRKAYKGMQKAKGSLKKGLSPEFIAIDVKETLDALGRIIGETVTDDLLDRVFGEFCIGK